MPMFIGEGPKQDLSLFQNLGAQLNQNKQQGIVQARTASAEFLKQGQAEADKLGLNMFDYMERNPEMYKGAMTTLMGGATNRANESWEGMSKAPRSSAQILNREFYKWAQGEYELDPTLFDTYKEEDVASSPQYQTLRSGGRTHEQAMEELKSIAESGENEWTGMAGVLGYESTKNEAGQYIWPDQFNEKFRDPMTKQVSGGKYQTWQDVPRKPPEIRENMLKEIRASLATGELPPITEEAVEAIKNEEVTYGSSDVDAESENEASRIGDPREYFGEISEGAETPMKVQKAKQDIRYLLNLPTTKNGDPALVAAEKLVADWEEYKLNNFQEGDSSKDFKTTEGFKRFMGTSDQKLTERPFETNTGFNRMFGTPESQQAETPTTGPQRPQLNTGFLGNLAQEGTVPQQETGLSGNPPQTRTVVDKPGLASRLAAGQDRLVKQSPNILTQPKQEALAIADSEATTTLKNAQAGQIAYMLQNPKAPEMTETQKSYIRMNEETYKKYLNMFDKQLNKDTQIEGDQWNELVEIYAKQFDTKPVEMSDGQKKLFGFLGAGTMLMIPGFSIPGAGSGLGQNSDTTVDDIYNGNYN